MHDEFVDASRDLGTELVHHLNALDELVTVEERRVRVVERGAVFAAEVVRRLVAELGLRLDDPAVETAVRFALAAGESAGARA